VESFFENSGVDPDGSKKSGTNCPSSAGAVLRQERDDCHRPPTKSQKQAEPVPENFVQNLVLWYRQVSHL